MIKRKDIFTFGKYKGRKVSEILYLDLKYIEYLIDKSDLSFSKEVLDICGRNSSLTPIELVIEKVKEEKKRLIKLYELPNYFYLKKHLGKELIRKKVLSVLNKAELVLYLKPPSYWVPDEEEIKEKGMGIDDKFFFGKHKGKTVRHVLLKDKSYIKWVLKKTKHKFKSEVLSIL